ncbi:MAG: phenylacetate-CoA oxygenase subunit PaaJ [Saprospiraceae bacterium]|nr:phenylacetate-CoA oxygenase subunit PaaJ [Saprospiraceae bacterium]MDW8482930.1 1,2-phenylacetyl-CoA epoxidase subunit PaaD [Saprospiraceae bacterium]
MTSASVSGTERIEAARRLLERVCDPEIPVLTVADLGILRDVRWLEEEQLLEVVITPTYSGCPAMDVIALNIRAVLQQGGFEHVRVITALSPAWTTDWLSSEAREKLRAFGIAPPAEPTADKRALLGERRILQCPHCHSANTEMIAPFASTACKAMFRCLDCLEPFEYFKCH